MRRVRLSWPDTPHLERRDKEKERSDAYLREMEEIAKQAVPLTPELKKKLGLGGWKNNV